MLFGPIQGARGREQAATVRALGVQKVSRYFIVLKDDFDYHHVAAADDTRIGGYAPLIDRVRALRALPALMVVAHR